MDDFARSTLYPAPTAMRPLLGVTVLVVEDSRFACEALRLMCLRSGARIRRADCLASARRHLAIYRPCVMLVDLGLPDGNGSDLIAEVANAPNPPVILATSADDFAEPVAIAAGAQGFLGKPHDSLSVFQEAILAHLPPNRQPGGPRMVNEEVINADQVSLRDDLAHIAEILHRDPDRHNLKYASLFLAGIARQAGDSGLEMAAARLQKANPDAPDLSRVTQLIDDRIAETPAI